MGGGENYRQKRRGKDVVACQSYCQSAKSLLSNRWHSPPAVTVIEIRRQSGHYAALIVMMRESSVNGGGGSSIFLLLLSPLKPWISHQLLEETFFVFVFVFKKKNEILSVAVQRFEIGVLIFLETFYNLWTNRCLLHKQKTYLRVSSFGGISWII